MKDESSVVFLSVSDIDETLKFYRDVVGLKIAQKQGESEEQNVFYDAPLRHIYFTALEQ